MAFNNHFFFEALVTPNSPTTIPLHLGDALADSFGSIATLRDELVATAEAMFGPGFVWLVQQMTPTLQPASQFRILTTYLAGSPFAEAHGRLQSTDMNTQNVGSARGLTGEEQRRQTEVQNSVGNFGPYASQETGPGGLKVTPVLCVNTWEHAWLPLYGVLGKREYLERWWENVDWNVVLNRSQLQVIKKDKFVSW